jgi:hypothetical protein
VIQGAVGMAFDVIIPGGFVGIVIVAYGKQDGFFGVYRVSVAVVLR